tara:strand:+ start:690 stop:1520 length:831 start_codon:yes stop_codon:yes gene_type:complete
MANRGLMYEDAIMYHALSNIQNPTLVEQTAILHHRSKISDQQVDDTARRMIGNLWTHDRNGPAGQQFYKSFKKLGGGRPEPKTDVLFVKNGQKYRCSIKFGEKWQFSSAGIQGNLTLMNRILQKISIAGSLSGVATIQVAQLLQWMQDEIASEPTKQVKSVISPRLAALKQSGSANDTLEKILGGKRNAQLDPLFTSFKREFIRENMTGAIAFGSSDDKCANYVMDMDNLYPINEQVINNLLDKVYVELRLKGRNTDVVSGERLNEIVLRVEQVNE